MSAVYGRVARMRRSWYERHPHARRVLARPVISVGNLTVGGSGKTPVVAALARLLLELGERPAILSRGYARKDSADGVVVVSDGVQVLEPVERSGDEPQMLARGLRGVPVLVSSDRYLAGCLAERRFGASVLLLDDGFQHLQLARAVDLLLVSPSDLNERVLPSGRLREPLEAARAADALLMTEPAGDASSVAARLGIEAVFTVASEFERLHPLDTVVSTPLPRNGHRVLAVSGIARPARFFAALRGQGWDVVREVVFPDHHWFTARDLARVAAIAREVSADLVVTTEKDAVRLDAGGVTGSAGASSASEPRWAFLPMRVVIRPEAAFTSWLRERL